METIRTTRRRSRGPVHRFLATLRYGNYPDMSLRRVFEYFRPDFKPAVRPKKIHRPVRCAPVLKSLEPRIMLSSKTSVSPLNFSAIEGTDSAIVVTRFTDTQTGTVAANYSATIGGGYAGIAGPGGALSNTTLHWMMSQAGDWMNFTNQYQNLINSYDPKMAHDSWAVGKGGAWSYGAVLQPTERRLPGNLPVDTKTGLVDYSSEPTSYWDPNFAYDLQTWNQEPWLYQPSFWQWTWSGLPL